MSGKVNRDSFYRLTSDLQDERVKAAVSLIEELSTLELPKYDDEWSYVLKRLISGLASSRNSARLGFSLCLSEVVKMALDKGSLAPQDLSTPDQYLELLSSNLSPDVATGKTKKELKGKDERGMLFGKMFGLQALLNEPLFSRVFFDEGGKVSPFALKFGQEVAQLAVKKNWLRESCLYTLFQTVQRLVHAMEKEMVSSLLLLLDKYQLTMTNEGLAIYLLLFHGKARNNGKSFKVQTSLALEFAAWKNNDPLSRGNLPQLSRVLCDASANDLESVEGSQPKTANWIPRLHFVWDILIPILSSEKSDEEISSKKSHKKKRDTTEKIEFPEFWQAAVDETFFSEKASSERKYLGFLVFMKAVESISSQWIQSCFTQNFMRTLINQSSDSNRLLNKLSQRALDVIVKSCEKNGSEKVAPCLDAILFGPYGSINFDRLTKSKTVSRLVAVRGLSKSGIDRLFNMFSLQLNRREELNKQYYQFVLDTVLHAVRTHRLEITPELIAYPLLDSIVMLAFFSKKDEAVNDLAKERLFSILSELTVQKNAQSWQYFTLKMILSKEATGNEPINKLDEDLKAMESEALEILRNVSSKAESPQCRGLEWLLSNCLLELYSGNGESLSIVEELCAFYREGLNESNSLVGITEILLSLLAQKKALLRKLSLIVWEQFVGDVGDQELKILLEVLDVRENKGGFAKLFENVDDYQEGGEEDEDDDQDEKGDKEPKVEKEDSEESVDEPSESETDSSSNSDVEDDGNIAKIDKEATSALAKALNLPENIVNEKGEVDVDRLEGENSDNDIAEDDDEEDEEEESMDDEEMMKLDEQLSQIFKRRKEALSGVTTGNERKIEVKEARETVITFKHRVIDMLEAYVKHADKVSPQENTAEIRGSKSDRTFENLFLLIEPLIKCLQLTLDKPLADKISKLLKGKLYKIRITAFQGAIDTDGLLKLLGFTHEALLTSKPGQFPALYFSTCSTTSLFLGKVLLESNSEDPGHVYERMIDIYADTTKQWMVRGKFGANVFSDFHNWLLSRKKTPQA